MYRGESISVVVPAYNEEGFVGGVIETMPDYVDRVYVIDDCSTDGTWEEIQNYAEQENTNCDSRTRVTQPTVEDGGVVFERRVVPIQHEENRGVGGAIKTGYKRALEDRIDITAVMAADGQMDPDSLDRLLDPIAEGRADYAKANRLVHRSYRSDMSNWRLFGNALLTFLTKISSGYWKMMDPQNGYTAISKQTLERLDIDSLYDRYGFLNELLVKLNVNDVRIADVPVPAVYGEEESHINYSRFIPRTSWLLLRGFLWRLRIKYLVLDFNPLALFYALGAIGSTLGVLGSGWSVYKKVVNNDPLFVPLTLSLMIFMTGSLFLLFAMLFDMQANEDKEIREFQ
jgi:glycosyltransferase involved in cell wall biosynthesis